MYLNDNLYIYVYIHTWIAKVAGFSLQLLNFTSLCFFFHGITFIMITAI